MCFQGLCHCLRNSVLAPGLGAGVWICHERATILMHKYLQFAFDEKKVLMGLLSLTFRKQQQYIFPFFLNHKCSDFGLSYAKNGELLKYIRKIGSFDETCTRFYTAEIVSALEYLHGKGIIHRYRHCSRWRACTAGSRSWWAVALRHTSNPHQLSGASIGWLSTSYDVGISRWWLTEKAENRLEMKGTCTLKAHVISHQFNLGEVSSCDTSRSVIWWFLFCQL